MKLDVLDELEIIKICTGYKYNGRIYKDFPLDTNMLYDVTPVYEEHPGWCVSIENFLKFKDLPVNTRKYINRIEELLRTKITLISVGSKRKQTIFR